MSRHSFVWGALLVGVGCSFQTPPADAGTEQVLYSFCSQQNCADGFLPYAGLIADSEDNLYGTTFAGGTPGCDYDDGCGVVFKLQPDGTYTVLHAFQNNGDGYFPYGDLVKVKGKLYGTTYSGGQYGEGTMFSVDIMTGQEIVLHSFGNDSDGASPYAGLTNAQGTFYGTTVYGGSGSGYGNGGTVFSFDLASGAETVIYSFCNESINCYDGAQPHGGLIYRKGLLYGTTTHGGSDTGCSFGCGTVYSLDLGTRTETVLHSFGQSWRRGSFPDGSLLNLGGKLYGTNEETLFSVDISTKKERTLARLGSQAGVIYVNDLLYDTTVGGGDYGGGSVSSFDLTTRTATTVYSFCSSPNCADGQFPEDKPLAINGALYGTTSVGGGYDGGTIFKITP